MKLSLSILTLLFPISVYAVFSIFVVIEPGSEFEKSFQFKLSHEDNVDMCEIEFLPVGYSSKHAWLVVSSRSLTREEQELRDFIWGFETRPEFIEMISKLGPMNNETIASKKPKEASYKIILKPKIAKTSYVYIDFPSGVFDGGAYYSIPLANYCDSSTTDIK